MPYYPQSQVKTNQQTNGSEYTLDGEGYAGPYFINSKGQAFTGLNPQSGNIRLLKKILPSQTESPGAQLQVNVSPLKQNSYFEVDYPYFAATGRNYNEVAKAPVKPIQEITFPTKQDYEIGELQRYFLKKSNEVQFIEVSQKQQDLYSNNSQKVQWQLYIPITISWVLEGNLKDVYNTNKNIVKLSETRNKAYGFVKYFNGRFAKFHKEEISNRKKEKTSTKIGGLR